MLLLLLLCVLLLSWSIVSKNIFIWLFSNIFNTFFYISILILKRKKKCTFCLVLRLVYGRIRNVVNFCSGFACVQHLLGISRVFWMQSSAAFPLKQMLMLVHWSTHQLLSISHWEDNASQFSSPQPCCILCDVASGRSWEHRYRNLLARIPER